MKLLVDLLNQMIILRTKLDFWAKHKEEHYIEHYIVQKLFSYSKKTAASVSGPIDRLEMLMELPRSLRRNQLNA